MFEKRRGNLIKEIRKSQLDGVLITNPSNLYYYSGFTGGDGMLMLLCGSSNVNSQKEKDICDFVCYLITDSRYYEQVEQECPEIALVRLKDRGYSEEVYDVVKDTFSGKREVSESEAMQCVCLEKCLEKDGRTYCKIGLESTLELSQYMKLKATCKEFDFTVAKDIIVKNRMIKDEGEIEKIAQAEAIGDAAFSHILEMIKPGVTEREIALELEFFMKRQGASRLSFDTIVASGPNSSMPHAQVTDRKIAMGDFVTMDFGCVYQGYCSDMTRTISVGNPTDEMKQVYQIVLDANLRAMEGVREGIACNVVDALARDYIKEQGYGDYFGHGLGHGVGLDIHEEPRFSPKCDVIAKENMVITDEPGIYLPGQFGVRIEDLLVVKKEGYRKLSHSEKNLIVL